MNFSECILYFNKNFKNMYSISSYEQNKLINAKHLEEFLIAWV